MDKASSNLPSASPIEGRPSLRLHNSVRLQQPSGQARIQRQPSVPSTVSGQEEGQQQRSRVTQSPPLSPRTPPIPPSKPALQSPLDLASLKASSNSRSIPQPLPKSHHRPTRERTLPALPLPLPSHKEATTTTKKNTRDTQDDCDSLDEDKENKPLPTPLAAAAAATTARKPSRQPSFWVRGFVARHPWVQQHRRRFVALVFAGVFVVLTLIIVLAVTLAPRSDDDDGLSSGGGGGDSTGGDSGGVDDIYHTGLKDKKKLADLKKFNAGKKPPPVNMAGETGWTDRGSGDGTYYDPALPTPFGFQMGACEFEYINSPKDMIAALNFVDFQASQYPRKMHSPACGQCLQVKGPKGSILVQVVDLCPGCKSGDLDLAPGAFAKIAEFKQGRVPITWSRCSPAQASSLNVVG